MANKLMFEVGITKAQGEYDKIYNEVMKLAEMGKNGIDLKIKFQQSTELKTFVDALKMIGDGKLLEPLLNKIESLQVSMVRLGMIPKDINYTALEKQLEKVTTAYENYQKARQKAGLKEGEAATSGAPMAMAEAYRIARANLEKEFGLTENVLRASLETWKNFDKTISQSLSNISSSDTGVKKVQTDIDSLTGSVNKLVESLSGANKIEVGSSNSQQQRVKTAEKIAEAEKSSENTITEKTTHQQKYNIILAETEKLLNRIGNAMNNGGDYGVLSAAQFRVQDFANRLQLVDKNDATAVANTIVEYNRLLKVYGDIVKEQEKSIDARAKAAEKAADAELKAAQKSADTVSKAEEKKQAEINKAWAEYDKQNQKQAESYDQQQQREVQAKEKSEQQKRDAAYKAAEEEVKARQKANDQILKEEAQMLAERKRLEEQSRKTDIKEGTTGISASEQRKREIAAAWAEQEKEDKKRYDELEKQRQKDLANQKKADEQAVQSAWKAAEKKIKADQQARAARERENQKATNAEIREYERAAKAKIKAQQEAEKAVQITNSSLSTQSSVLSDLKSMAMQYLSVWGAQSFINNIIELGGQLEQQRLSIGAILQDTAQANHLFGQIKDLAIKSPFGVQQLDAMSKQLSAYGFQYSELYEWTKRLADISAATGTSVDRLALALGHVRAEGALSGYTLRQFSMGNIPLLQKLSENLGKTKQEIRKMTRNKEIGYEDVLNVLKQLTDESGMFYQAQETMSQALNAKFKNLRDSFQIMYSEMAEGAPGDFLKGVAEVLTDISKSWRVLMPLILSGGATLGIWKLSTMALNHELERSGKLLVGNAIATSKYSMNQLRAIATTGRFKIALQGLGRALASIGKFVFNPVTLGFAAVEGLIYLWSKHNDEVRRAKDLTKAYGEEAVESEKNIAKQLENVKPFSNKLDDSALKTGIDSMTESIKNYAINGQSIINGMFSKDAEGNVMSLADKYQYLRGELEETIKVYKELKRVKDAFEYGITKSDDGWFDDDVDTDLTQYSEAYKKFVDDVTEYNSKYNNSIEKAIRNAQNSDLAFREATKNMKSYGEMLAEFWSNPTKYQNAAQFMNNLFGAGAGSDDALNLNESFFGYLNKKNEAMKELDQFIANTEERLKEKGYDFSKELAPEQVGALLKMSKEWIEKHPEWENIYGTIKEKLEGRWPIKIVPDTSPVEEELPEWMEEFQKELDKTGIVLTADMSMEQIVDLMKKAYDQAQTTINKLGPVALTAKINVVGMSEDEIEAYNNPLSPNYNPEMYQWLKQLKGAYNKRDTVDAAAKKRGIKLEGMKKDGTHKAEKQNQENAKAVREQVRVIKEAADAFQYWREKVGDKGAWEHVQKEFGDVLAKIDITANNIEDVREHLKKIPQTKEYQAITDKKVKTEINKEIAKENDQYTRKDFERDTERFLSQTQLQLDSLTRAWDTFNSVREATGNIELAKQLSGVTYDEDNLRNLAEATRSKIESDFAAAGAITIPLNIDLSDKQIEDKVHKAFADAAPKREDFEDTEKGLEAYNRALMQHETRIKGVIEETKKLRDLQRDLYKNDISVFTKAWNDDRDRYQQFTKAVGRYEAESQSLKRLLDQWNNGDVDEETGLRLGINNDQYMRALENLTNRSNWEKFKARTGFNWLSSNVDNLGLVTVRRMINSLKEYAATTQMSAEETEAWYKAINMFTNKEAVLDPINGITQAIENYNRAMERRQDAKNKYDQAINNPNATPQQIADASQHYDEAVAAEIEAFESLKKAIKVLADKFTQFGSDLQNFGQQLGGTVGDILGGFGQIFTSVGNGMNAIQNINLGATGISKILGYAQTTIGIVGSMIGLFQGVSSLFPTTDSLYEHYAAKQRKVNQLREAVDNYRIAVARASAEEKGWIGGGDALDNLRKAYDIHGEVVLAYYSKLQEAQEQYVESSAGIKKAIIPIIAAITAVAAVAAGVFSGGTGTVALWGLGTMAMNALGASAIAATLSATTIAAIGAAVAATAGAVVGQAVQSGIDAITYKEGQIDARRNMRVQTQHHTFFRSEKTQNLEEWAKENLGVDLFDKAGLIDLKAAQAVLDSGATLVGETKETLEKLMELREQYDEWEKSIRDYISDRFSGIADDMTNAIWDWLTDGENALDKFHDYASDTFKQIAQDAVKSFLKVTVLDSFQEQLENMYKAYSMKDKNGNRVLSEAGLMAGVASVAGEMAAAFEATLPAAENLATIIKDAFEFQGYDITNKESSSSASSQISKSITEEQGNLVVAYLNAMRADLSVVRELDAKTVQEYWPSQIRLMTAGTQSLANIESHTSAIMRSNDAIERSNQSILDSITGLKNRTWSVPMA